MITDKKAHDTRPYCYIAGPFFNEAQTAVIELIKQLCDKLGVKYFSPKDECMFEPGVTTPAEVVEQNVKALDRVDFAVVVTDGKDPGTLFEAGYCYAEKVPMIYCWFGAQPGQKFNIMLAATGSVAKNMPALEAHLHRFIDEDYRVITDSVDAKEMQ